MRKKSAGILLVQPSFPIPNKSTNHKDYFPIGILKIASHFVNIEHNANVKVVYGNVPKDNIINKIGYPKKIYITSLFTYWADYCFKSFDYYTSIFPKAEFYFGGIYVSLMEDEIRSQLLKRYPGISIEIRPKLNREAEEANIQYGPQLNLLPNYKDIDYLIVHTMRGCHRTCKFCGTYKIEDEDFWSGDKFKAYITMVKQKYPQIKKLVFYDNNFLKNLHSRDILREIISLKKARLITSCESQSGFDGRLLDFEMANLIKAAGFVSPKIAWDGAYGIKDKVKAQIDLLVKVGYECKEISVFMIYNWDIRFDEMIKKVKACYDWKVQVTDCRNRPLYRDKLDGYKPHKVSGQSKDEYYIHNTWKDWQVRLFRKIVRKGNIMARMNWDSTQYNQWLFNKKINKTGSGSSSRFIDDEIQEYGAFYEGNGTSKISNQCIGREEVGELIRVKAC